MYRVLGRRERVLCWLVWGADEVSGFVGFATVGVWVGVESVVDVAEEVCTLGSLWVCCCNGLSSVCTLGSWAVSLGGSVQVTRFCLVDGSMVVVGIVAGLFGWDICVSCVVGSLFAKISRSC